MNHLCHALPFLTRPWALAGTALPDWLSALGRERRIRPWHLPRPGGGGRRGDLVRGVARHFADDAWFHATPAFRDAVRVLGARIRAETPPGTRAGFYAHVLVEILLDSHVAAERPEALGAFEAALGVLDPEEVEREAAALAPARPAGLARLVDRFRSARVIAAHAADDAVADRLTALGRRVRQPAFPGPEVVAWARPLVAARAPALLDGGSPV